MLKELPDSLKGDKLTREKESMLFIIWFFSFIVLFSLFFILTYHILNMPEATVLTLYCSLLSSTLVFYIHGLINI